MTAYADLEIGLHEQDGQSRWRVDMRFRHPQADAASLPRGSLSATIDPRALSELADDATEYGRVLGGALFSDAVAAAYEQARVAAESSGVTMRVRLNIGPTAARLHRVRWETMLDPRDGSRMLTNQNILFSRYLGSSDYRQVVPLPKSSLTALALVAGPSGLDGFDVGRTLAPVRVDDEVETVRTGLAGIPLEVLAGPGRATTAQLFTSLQESCDVLYIVCHGYQRDIGPVLVLEGEDGSAVTLPGYELVQRLEALTRLPRLAVLASCQSAGSDDDRHTDDAGALASLGPQLAQAGVPAVLAMQGNISMATVSQFMPVFFRELLRDGQIDRAVATARSAVQDNPDWWAPALFMRLGSGRLWYEPGVGSTDGRWSKFPALVEAIRTQQCTPILGPGLTDSLLGSRQEIAQQWATKFSFPMALHERDDLPQVAQYLSVDLHSEQFPRDELAKHLRDSLLRGYGDALPDKYRDLPPEDLPLGQLMSDAWKVRYPDGGTDPYALLAELPLPVYLTVQPWNLLAEALRAAGKDPTVEVCQWKRLKSADAWGGPSVVDTPDWAFAPLDTSDKRVAAARAGWPASVFDEQPPTYRPDAQHPLVYHLFGHQARPRSIVLTEDDYFEFLIGATRQADGTVANNVSRAMAASTLMFLGFRLDEWDFRVLFKSIVSQEGRDWRGKPHVAVQIDPEEGHAMEPTRARRYLEGYFGTSDITIFWGSTESFIKELQAAWRDRT